MTPDPKSRLRRAWELIDFWSPLPEADRLSDQDREALTERLLKVPADGRQVLTRSWERQYDEIREDTASVRARGVALLTATGVISGVLALLVPLATGLHSTLNLKSLPLVFLTLIAILAFVLILYCAVGTVVLAIRAQEVAFWGQSELHILDRNGKVRYEIEYAISLYVTYTDNVQRLRNPAGYLRQAQVYFRTLVQALAAFVAVALLLVALGATSQPTNASQVPSPRAEQRHPQHSH